MDPPYPRLFAYYEGYELPYALQYSLAAEHPLGLTEEEVFVVKPLSR